MESHKTHVPHHQHPPTSNWFYGTIGIHATRTPLWGIIRRNQRWFFLTWQPFFEASSREIGADNRYKSPCLLLPWLPWNPNFPKFILWTSLLVVKSCQIVMFDVHPRASGKKSLQKGPELLNPATSVQSGNGPWVCWNMFLENGQIPKFGRLCCSSCTWKNIVQSNV